MPANEQSSPTSGPAAVLQQYFAETLGGDLAAVDRYFPAAPDYVLIADDGRDDLPWVGRQTDREGIKRAYGLLLDALDVIDSRPGTPIEQEDRVAISGEFTYRARATGKTAKSAWAVFATVHDNRIVKYRFYEDSGAVAASLRAE